MNDRKLKIAVVCPAYNCEKTLARTIADIPPGIADEIILVDDCSHDHTIEKARELGLKVFPHERNTGYGGNQKTCYREALAAGADIVVMLHPDYQYDPTAIPALVEPIVDGRADAVFGSRMMKGGALLGGMPLWKHNGNILLTAVENVVLSTYLTEYHSGFRAYSAPLLRTIWFERNHDNFVFDTEIIIQIVNQKFRIEEIPIQTRYFPQATSLSFVSSVRYGLQILWALTRYLLQHHLHLPCARFERKPDAPPPMARPEKMPQRFVYEQEKDRKTD